MFQQGTLRLEVCIGDLNWWNRLRQISNNATICHKLKALVIIGTTTGLIKHMMHPQCDENSGYSSCSRKDVQACVRRLVNLESIELRVNTPTQVKTVEKDFTPKLLEQMNRLFYNIQISCGLKVKSLKSLGFLWKSPRCIGPDLSGGPESRMIQGCTGRLSRLDITSRVLDRESAMRQEAGLPDLLACMPNLEELTLNMEVDFSRVCELRFHRLRSIKLAFGLVLQHKLLQFFNNHAGLKELRLETLHLRGGRWNTLLRRMSEGPLRLEKFLLSGHLADLWLCHRRLYLCGEHATPMADSKVVRNGSVEMTYPANPEDAVERNSILDRAIAGKRAAAGLPCDLCETCGRPKPERRGRFDER